MATKQPNQKSYSAGDMYLARVNPVLWSPTEFSANAWRAAVNAQEVACVCKDTLISTLSSLDWKIVCRDSKMQDELKGTIKYYTTLLERAGYGNLLDFTSHIEWIASDMLDTPFGGACEIGRKNSDPNGRVAWIEPLDAATLYPTNILEYPVVQNYNTKTVYFDKYSISRAFISPKSQIERKGWGMPPPEKIFRSLQMLSKGDQYYANLLLDVPTAGVLDLGDIDENSARSWIESFKTIMSAGSIDSFKIPVLYEHNNPVTFLSFGKVPNDIMFDRITMKYAALVCAAYGMTLGDIGLTEASGGTLAGTIRDERRTKKTGFARLKKKLKFYFDQILPDTLEFIWIDYDDELNVALGRARLANATAFGQWISNHIFSPKELRAQAVQDGLVTVDVPEDVPEADFPQLPQPKPSNNNAANNKTPERPGALGSTSVPASQGGNGEVVTGKSISEEYLPMLSEFILQDIKAGTLTMDNFMIAKGFGLDELPEEVVADIAKEIWDGLDDIDIDSENGDNIRVVVENILSKIQIQIKE